MVKYTIKEPNKEEPFTYKGKKMEFTYKITATGFFRIINKLYPEKKLRLIRNEQPDVLVVKKGRASKDVTPK